MNLIHRIHRIRRAAGLLAGLTLAWLAVAVAAPAAFAVQAPPGGGPGSAAPLAGGKHPPVTPAHMAGSAHQVRTIVVGGMPGWQIALIAVMAALITAFAAVLVERTRVGRRRPVRPLA